MPVFEDIHVDRTLCDDMIDVNLLLLAITTTSSDSLCHGRVVVILRLCQEGRNKYDVVGHCEIAVEGQYEESMYICKRDLHASCRLASQIEYDELFPLFRICVRLEVLHKLRCRRLMSTSAQGVIRDITVVEHGLENADDLLVWRENDALIRLWNPLDKLGNSLKLVAKALTSMLVVAYTKISHPDQVAFACVGIAASMYASLFVGS